MRYKIKLTTVIKDSNRLLYDSLTLASYIWSSSSMSLTVVAKNVIASTSHSPSIFVVFYYVLVQFLLTLHQMNDHSSNEYICLQPIAFCYWCWHFPPNRRKRNSKCNENENVSVRVVFLRFVFTFIFVPLPKCRMNKWNRPELCLRVG